MTVTLPLQVRARHRGGAALCKARARHRTLPRGAEGALALPAPQHIWLQPAAPTVTALSAFGHSLHSNTYGYSLHCLRLQEEERRQKEEQKKQLRQDRLLGDEGIGLTLTKQVTVMQR